jgi:N-acetylneuraminic acid mutarotase
VSEGGALTCPRDGTSTRLTCVECETPICPACAVRTPVGLKCPDHARAPVRAGGGRRSRQAVVLLVLAAVAGGAYAVQRMATSQPAAFPCPTQTSPDVGIGPESQGTSWSELARSPLCGRFAAATAWTGAEFLVWGGQNCAGELCPADRAPRMADGAAYDPERNRWRRLADSPLEGRDSAASVWTGRELIVWGGSGRTGPLADGAAYDPARDRWRPLAASPLSARSGAAVAWTGSELVVWGGIGAVGGPGEADGARYDPEADTWAPLPAVAASAHAAPAAAWTGREVLVWASAGAGGMVPPEGRAYDPARDAWRPLADGPLVPRAGQAAAWTGRELVIWGGDRPDGGFHDDGAAYDPTTNTWRRLPPSPISGRSNMLAVWTGAELLLWGGLGHPDPGAARPGLARNSPFRDPEATVPLDDGAAYDPAADRWRAIEPTTLLARGYPLGAWDGQRLIVWGGITLVDSTASAADGARHTR